MLTEGPLPLTGVDEDWSKADPKTLVTQGFDFAIGYVSQDTTGKNITRQQVDALHAAGLSVALVFEFAPQSARGGGWAGTQDAHIAVTGAQKLGAPQGMTIYFAVDYDARSGGELITIAGYAMAVTAVCEAAGYRAGIYGSFYVCDFLHAHGFEGYLWQTYAWSNNQWSPHAVLRQTQNGIHVGTATVDRDQAQSYDYGQWRPDGGVGGTPMTRPSDDRDVAALEWRLDALHTGNPIVQGGPVKGETMWLVTAVQTLLDRTAPAEAPPPDNTHPVELAMLDVWGRVATALESIAGHMDSADAPPAAPTPPATPSSAPPVTSQPQATQSGEPFTPWATRGAQSPGLVMLNPDAPPSEPATASTTTPVDTQP